MKKEESYVKYFFVLLILLVLIISGALAMKSGRLPFLFEGIGLSLGASVTWLYWKKKH